MRAIRILIPPVLYAELCEAAASKNEPGFGPAAYATELVISEMAARRLPKITPARNGARVAAKAGTEPERYRIVLPVTEVDA